MNFYQNVVLTWTMKNWLEQNYRCYGEEDSRKLACRGEEGGGIMFRAVNMSLSDHSAFLRTRMEHPNNYC